MTPNLVADESSRVMLSCLAEGDPAPEVVWRSPTNDGRIGVSPPSDRQRTRTRAFWELRNVRIDQSAGWYSCEATNLAGSRTGYTYLHVARTGDPPRNVSGLVFTAAVPPEPETATVTSRTHPVVTSSSSTFRSVTSSSRRSSSTSGLDFHTASVSGPTQDGGAGSTSGGVGPTTTAVRGSHLTTESAESDAFWKKVLLILGSAAGGILFLVLLFAAVVLCIRLGRKRRRRRRRAKSVPPTSRTIRDDIIRRPAKPFPGISMAGAGLPDVQTQALALQGRSLDPDGSALPVSPTYAHPERLDLLSSSDLDRSCEQLHTFERRKNGNGGGVNVT